MRKKYANRLFVMLLSVAVLLVSSISVLAFENTFTMTEATEATQFKMVNGFSIQPGTSTGSAYTLAGADHQPVLQELNGKKFYYAEFTEPFDVSDEIEFDFGYINVDNVPRPERIYIGDDYPEVSIFEDIDLEQILNCESEIGITNSQLVDAAGEFELIYAPNTFNSGKTYYYVLRKDTKLYANENGYDLILKFTTTGSHQHEEEAIYYVAPTCTEPGSTEGKKCSLCEEVLVEPKVIPALGHDYKNGECTRCGAKDPNYKPSTPSSDTHTPSTVPKVPEEPTTVKFNGLANEAAKDHEWYYYTDGVIDTKHNGVEKNKYGWWRVEEGRVNFNAQGIYKNAYGWWKTTDGKVTFEETGVFKNEYGWWRVEDSKVNFDANGIYKNAYGWWKTTNGKVTFKENGVFKNEYGWWKVENSKVNFKYNGVASNEYGTWYIKNGKVDFSFNGTYNSQTFRNGKLVSNSTVKKQTIVMEGK